MSELGKSYFGIAYLHVSTLIAVTYQSLELKFPGFVLSSYHPDLLNLYQGGMHEEML
jgi:hypothetical protein